MLNRLSRRVWNFRTVALIVSTPLLLLPLPLVIGTKVSFLYTPAHSSWPSWTAALKDVEQRLVSLVTVETLSSSFRWNRCVSLTNPVVLACSCSKRWFLHHIDVSPAAAAASCFSKPAANHSFNSDVLIVKDKHMSFTQLENKKKAEHTFFIFHINVFTPHPSRLDHFQHWLVACSGISQIEEFHRDGSCSVVPKKIHFPGLKWPRSFHEASALWGP